jgi:outer membrane biosynthesis protein TonB
MENSANIMRIALIVSIIAHVLFVTFSARDLRPTSHGETMTVDLVPANEAPAASAAPKSDPSAAQSKQAKPEPKADTPSSAQAPAAKVESKPSETKAPDAKTPETKIAQAKPAPPSATAAKPVEQKPPQLQQPPTEQQPPQQQSAAQPPELDPTSAGSQGTVEDVNRVASMLGLPFGYDTRSGGQGPPMAKFTEGVKEFKEQVRKCLKLPAGVAPTQHIEMVFRIPLRRNGALAGDPDMYQAIDNPFGPQLRDSAIRAIRQCAPYRLPADKYEEWKVLDIDFSPDQMMGS